MNWIFIFIGGILLLLFSASVGYTFKGRINSNLKTFLPVPTKQQVCGKDVADAILKRNNLADVEVVEIDCKNTNIIVPKQNVIKLSGEVSGLRTVTSISIAALLATKMVYAKTHRFEYGLVTSLQTVTMIVALLFLPLLIVCPILDLFFLLAPIGKIMAYCLLGVYFLAMALSFVLFGFDRKLTPLAHQNLLELKLIDRDEEQSTRRVLGSISLFPLSRSLASSIFLLYLMNLDQLIPSN